MITTIVLKGANYMDVKSTYAFFKDETYVMREFSNGFLLIFSERNKAHKCMNKARKRMLSAGCKIEYKRYNYILTNGCIAQINL
jgi:hypothetical protein